MYPLVDTHTHTLALWESRSHSRLARIEVESTPGADASNRKTRNKTDGCAGPPEKDRMMEKRG